MPCVETVEKTEADRIRGMKHPFASKTGQK